jgi:signal peptidase I
MKYLFYLAAGAIFFAMFILPILRARRVTRDHLRSILTTLFIAFVLIKFVVQAVGGGSGPTSAGELISDLAPGDYWLVLKPVYLFEAPKRGDLVMFYFANGDHLISRVIGISGETVEVYHGEIKINGQTLREDYALVRPAYDYTVVVPKDSVFVLPDRRVIGVAVTAGSQVWGTISYSELDGKAWFRYWPLSRMGFIRRPSYEQEETH